MNSIIAVSVLALLVVAITSAVPAPHVLLVEEPAEFEDALGDGLAPELDTIIDESERSDRHARATCDLLSISLPIGSLNHAACAAHCLAMRKGYRGGRCKDGVCHCRR